MTSGPTQLARAVAIFVDPNTDAEDIRRFSSEMPIWIADTPRNHELALQARAMLDGARLDWITTFDVSVTFEPTATAIGMSDMVRLHHSLATRYHVVGLPEGGENDARWVSLGLNLISRKANHAVFACEEYDLL